MSRMLQVAGLVVALGFAVPARAQEAGTTAGPAIVTVGEAATTVAPDRAYIQVSAEGRAQKAADAQQLAATAMTSLQNALKGAGVAADAIRTTGYNLTPENDYVNGRQTFRDYLARNQVEVRVDDLSRLSAIIDASGAAGAATVSGLRFDLKNRDVVEQATLKRAVADAMARATAIASGANRTLGAIVRIQDQRISNARPVYMAFDSLSAGRAGGGAPTPVEPGEIEVRAQVTVTVAIR